MGYFTFVSQGNYAHPVQTSSTFGDRTPKVNFSLYTFTCTFILDVMCTLLPSSQKGCARTGAGSEKGDKHNEMCSLSYKK